LKRGLPLEEAEILRLLRFGGVWTENSRTKNPEARIETPVTVYEPSRPVEEFTLDPALLFYEDERILAVRKPGRVNTCETPFSDIDCLSWGVEKYLRVQGVDTHVNAVHRLDQPARGLVLFGKDKEAEKRLHGLFQKRKIHKLYRALTPEFNRTGERWLFRDTLEWRGKEKSARTWVRYAGQKENRLYFDAYPLTGRTHQIRKHFARYLAPIVGDGIYGGYPLETDLELCCWYYRFRHPFTGKKLELCDLPERCRPD
jgi:23S rRNA pseudouridine1911/1915/1917 synthase